MCPLKELRIECTLKELRIECTLKVNHVLRFSKARNKLAYLAKLGLVKKVLAVSRIIDSHGSTSRQSLGNRNYIPEDWEYAQVVALSIFEILALVLHQREIQEKNAKNQTYMNHVKK